MPVAFTPRMHGGSGSGEHGFCGSSYVTQRSSGRTGVPVITQATTECGICGRKRGLRDMWLTIGRACVMLTGGSLQNMNIKIAIQLTVLFIGICLSLTSLLILDKIRIIGFEGLQMLAVAIVQLILGVGLTFIALKWMLKSA